MTLRYIKLWLSLAKFSLLGEMAFRGNFLFKVVVEMLWLGILLLFNFTVFQQTSTIADWTANEFLFFIGCFFAMGGLMHADADVGIGVADAQPEPVRDVVAVHDADALSARDLPGEMGVAGGVVFLVRGADHAGDQRAGQRDGAHPGAVAGVLRVRFGVGGGVAEPARVQI